ncbi:Crp/Fnr family transcriptional regulator [[Flexibacter] sp. ATCC 35103]|uniref:Crp/Fnr family transcriptional regulator n=1 Tax=[Flexibacter] sp. ATCC 35103 TaxID=1937528 RepID=UPI0009C9C205|nr:Crp/Fnr family transcriptional regulator [[Flexibacter] sp. ATCC 35103]OMQ10039.1 cyclic nucleotide-binding protein [[Flexibacter] sp. ATCC 35103]
MESLIAVFEKLELEMHHFEKFNNELQFKVLKKKEHLIQEGFVCEFIGIVKSGKLRSYVQNDGVEYNNDFYLENSFVTAYTSYLTQSPTNCNIEALAETEIMYITLKKFNQLIEDDFAFLKLAKYISDIFFIRKCRRETSFLKNSAAERLEMLYKTHPGIGQQISQYHIASYLGIKPESLSRIKLLTYINK